MQQGVAHFVGQNKCEFIVAEHILVDEGFGDKNTAARKGPRGFARIGPDRQLPPQGRAVDDQGRRWGA